MWEDPIIEEIHKIRQEHAAKFNFDVRAIVRYYQEQQKQSGRKVVSFSCQSHKETGNDNQPQRP